MKKKGTQLEKVHSDENAVPYCGFTKLHDETSDKVLMSLPIEEAIMSILRSHGCLVPFSPCFTISSDLKNLCRRRMKDLDK